MASVDLMGIHDGDHECYSGGNGRSGSSDSFFTEKVVRGEQVPHQRDKAKKDNAAQLPRIGFFNDTERDAIRG